MWEGEWVRPSLLRLEPEWALAAATTQGPCCAWTGPGWPLSLHL